MEQTNIMPEEQKTQPNSPLRAWVTPVFERVKLKDALFNTSMPNSDGVYGDYFHYS
jgi:hypothetical protein